MSGLTSLISDIALPRFVRARQLFDHNEISQREIADVIEHEIEAAASSGRLRAGMRICITCGSRGIDNMTFAIKTISDSLKRVGAEPYMIPAMGSHGGATAEGQVEILRSLGITEESIGCPLLSSMDTVKISHVEDFDVRIDKNAAEGDGIIAINRVKAHTSFQGPYESGLMKMLTIGIGKQHGAYITHSKGDDSMSHRIEMNAREVIAHANVIMGVALVENAFDRTCAAYAMPGDEIPDREPDILARAKREMSRIWIDECDVLFVGALGKNYTGAGMDPNIVGRCVNPKLKMGITAQRIAISDLTDESHGNATGMGRADFATERFYKKISFADTYPNAVTSYNTSAYRIPLIVDGDDELLRASIASALGIDRESPRIIMINNSLEIEDILISTSLIDEAKRTGHIEIRSEPFELEFDSSGYLTTKI